MSLNKADYNSLWASCPADILLMVFKKLDIESLLNCIYVNKLWRNVVEYHCEHFHLWKAMVQHGIDDEGVTFAEKSKLGWRDCFLSAQQWLNVGNVKVHLLHCYKFDCSIKNICVNGEKLIVATDNAVKYFNIKNSKLIKVVKLERPCVKYEETSSIIAEVSLPPDDVDGIILLTLTNKLNTNDSERVITIHPKDIDTFKIHLNICYEYTGNVLWMRTAMKTGWETKSLGKYYGTHQFFSIHVFKKNVYVLLKSGNVLMADKKCKALIKVFEFQVPQFYLKTKPFMFHVYNLLIPAPEPCFECKIECHGFKYERYIVTMFRYGVTCVVEHGHVLLIGYQDGRIEIYITKNLMSNLPELVLDLRTYLDETKHSESNLNITSLDIYEDIKGHRLLVSTMSIVYELLL